MPRFQEKPRGSAGNRMIENISEKHCPCVVLIDTSGSMRPYVQDLVNALNEFRNALNGDADARARVEIEIVTFDSSVHKLEGFGPVSSFSVPDIVCDGTTCTHDAVQFAMEELEARKVEYKQQGTPYYRPWLVLLTDGGSNDGDVTQFPNAFRDVLQAQRDKHLVYYGIAIGNEANRNEVGSMHVNGLVLTPETTQFSAIFEWLSSSLVTTSINTSTDITVVPNPSDNGISWSQVSIGQA